MNNSVEQIRSLPLMSLCFLCLSALDFIATSKPQGPKQSLASSVLTGERGATETAGRSLQSFVLAATTKITTTLASTLRLKQHVRRAATIRNTHSREQTPTDTLSRCLSCCFSAKSQSETAAAARAVTTSEQAAYNIIATVFFLRWKTALAFAASASDRFNSTQVSRVVCNFTRKSAALKLSGNCPPVPTTAASKLVPRLPPAVGAYSCAGPHKAALRSWPDI
ncbi:unnamed protein product [Polarella glacialis]|uniref:Secreted protein n=1 Tax=Polarella glacialis TaxID=89957 RepID=A0A813DAY4_POLGL|nr:unnamed protein product [Polarella glacialis]